MSYEVPESNMAAAVCCSAWFGVPWLRELPAAVVEHAAAVRPPPHILELIEVPEPNRPHPLRPRLAARQPELVAEVVGQVEPVVDDVRLVDREHRVARLVGLVRHHPVHANRE